MLLEDARKKWSRIDDRQSWLEQRGTPKGSPTFIATVEAQEAALIVRKKRLESVLSSAKPVRNEDGTYDTLFERLREIEVSKGTMYLLSVKGMGPGEL